MDSELLLAIKYARTSEQWRKVHQEVSTKYEAALRERKMGEPESAESKWLEAMATLTHEVVDLRSGIQHVLNGTR
jgi:hypothetical protein